MAQRKKIIARLVLQGISILGILLGFTFFYIAIGMIFLIQRDNLTELCLSLFISVCMFVLAAFLIYPSYLMLRGKSFGVIETIAVLLAWTLPAFVFLLVEAFTTTLDSEKKAWPTEPIVVLVCLLVYLLVLVLVYKISVKLFERLKEAAYGPEKTSETQNSTDKQ